MAAARQRLELRASELKKSVDAKRKRLDYLRVAVEDLKRSKAPSIRVPAPEANDDGDEELRSAVEALRGARTEWLDRLTAVSDEQRRVGKELDVAKERLAKAAQRRAAFIVGDDYDAPWVKAKHRARHAKGRLEFLKSQISDTSDLDELQRHRDDLLRAKSDLQSKLDDKLSTEATARNDYLAFCRGSFDAKAKATSFDLSSALRVAMRLVPSTTSRHS